MTLAAILRHKNKQALASGGAGGKGGAVVGVAPHDSISHVTRVLAERRIGAVVVLDHDGRLLGILSERDIIRCLSTDGAHVLERRAEELMTPNPRTAGPGTTVTQAMTMMTEGRFRHIPVLDERRLLGIVSIGDVVNARLQDQAQEVDSLRAYVAGAA